MPGTAGREISQTGILLTCASQRLRIRDDFFARRADTTASHNGRVTAPETPGCSKTMPSRGRNGRPISISAMTFFSLLAAPVFATSSFYDDLRATSSNGRFIAEARSPDNAESKRRPSADEFTITLTESGSDKPLWSHTQTKDESAPVCLVPTDDGYLIVEDAGSWIAVFDMAGTQKIVVNVLLSTPADERERFVEFTTAGPFWRQFALRDFVRDDAGALFILRTYWGRLFVIDYKNARWLDESDVVSRVETKVVADTRDWLKTFSGNLKSKCASCDRHHYSPEVSMRLCIIRLHGIPEGMQYVEQVLAAPDDGRSPSLGRELPLVPQGEGGLLPEAKRELDRLRTDDQSSPPPPSRTVPLSALVACVVIAVCFAGGWFLFRRLR